MDVVLLKDVDRLGKEGTVARVKPGYARNFLVPRGLALAATTQNMRRIEAIKREASVRQDRRRKELEGLKGRLESHRLTLSLAVGENDTPFGSVSAHDIAQALSQAGFAVDRAMIQLEHAIKSLGAVEVPVRLQADLVALVKVSVVKA
jgi:large subunit ribosomal protein L9